MHHTEILALMVDDNYARSQMIRNWMMDPKELFEERKEVWLATPEHLYSKEQFVIHLNEYEAKHGEISWYDDFYAEKDSVVDLVNECKNAIEECEGQDPADWDHHYFTSEEMLNDFIRACLDLGVHSFTYDW